MNPAKPVRRPPMMRARPLWLRNKLYYHLYAGRKEALPGLFESAALEFAPGVSLELMPTDVGHKAIAYSGFYELPVSRRIAQLAKAGGMMVDVGANFGYYSCLWAAGAASNRVIAFEASPRNIVALRANLGRNQFASRVDVREMAVGKTKGRLSFLLGPADQSGWGGFATMDEEGGVEVDVVTADEALPAAMHPKIAVIKIDVEGADTWVIEGARQLLASHRVGHVFFEQNFERMAALGIEIGRAQTMLSETGYRVREIEPGEWYADLPGWKP